MDDQRRRGLRVRRVADDPERLAAYLKQQCIDMNCPCGGDVEHHDAYVAVDRARWARMQAEALGKLYDQAMEQLASQVIATNAARDRYLGAVDDANRLGTEAALVAHLRRKEGQ